MRMFAARSFALVCIAASSTAWGADWKHYRGPTLDGITAEALPAGFAKAEPKRLWTAKVGTGTAAVVTSGDRAYTMGHEGGNDVIRCLDARTGKEIWVHRYPQELDPKNFEGGPRATPTLDGNRLYTVSHQGDLWCLDATTGSKIWYKHYQQDFEGDRPDWGYAGSPTVDGNLLLLDVGADSGSTLALDKATGKTVWRSGDDEAGYGSITVANIGGQRTAVAFKAEAVVGYDVKSGKELWRTAWKTSWDVNAMTPIVVGNEVLITSGYGTGGTVLTVNRSVSKKWQTKKLASHFNSPVIWKGHVYGVHGNDGPKGELVCLELASGQEKWRFNLGGGSLICAAGELVCLNEKGELMIGPASPAGFKPTLRTQVIGVHCWVQPVWSNGRLFVKNNTGDLACYSFGP